VGYISAKQLTGGERAASSVELLPGRRARATEALGVEKLVLREELLGLEATADSVQSRGGRALCRGGGRQHGRGPETGEAAAAGCCS
jgi:hypothetical protein